MSGSQHRYTLPSSIGRPEHWSFTWAIADNVTFDGTCGFCGQKEQRLTYEVSRDAERTSICGRCAGRYDIGGALNGAALSPQEARAHLHGLSVRLKQHTCQKTIRKAAALSEDTALLEVSLYFDRNLQLSPRHAACLFAALDEFGDAIDRRIFEIQMRSQAHQGEFGDLDGDGRRAVWSALTPQQRRRVTALGFAPRRSARTLQSETGAFAGATI